MTISADTTPDAGNKGNALAPVPDVPGIDPFVAAKLDDAAATARPARPAAGLQRPCRDDRRADRLRLDGRRPCRAPLGCLGGHAGQGRPIQSARTGRRSDGRAARAQPRAGRQRARPAGAARRATGQRRRSRQGGGAGARAAGRPRHREDEPRRRSRRADRRRDPARRKDRQARPAADLEDARPRRSARQARTL